MSAAIEDPAKRTVERTDKIETVVRVVTQIDVRHKLEVLIPGLGIPTNLVQLRWRANQVGHLPCIVILNC